jgi:hypothetical protein
VYYRNERYRWGITSSHPSCRNFLRTSIDTSTGRLESQWSHTWTTGSCSGPTCQPTAFFANSRNWESPSTLGSL